MPTLKPLLRSLAAHIPEMEVTRRVDGHKMRLLTSQAIDLKLICGMSHEPASVRALRRLVKPGMHVLDIGANIGVLTLLLARLVGRSGRVDAVEASDWTFDRLAKNVALNQLRHVRLHRALVGSTVADAVTMKLPCGYRVDGRITATLQTIPTLTVDRLVAGKRVDLIKCDTDGHEPAVFVGAVETLARHHPALLFEVAPTHCKSSGNDLAQMFGSLFAAGYEFQSETGEAIDPFAAMTLIPRFGSINVVALHAA
jgi:FkbM family methyltransferase